MKRILYIIPIILLLSCLDSSVLDQPSVAFINEFGAELTADGSETVTVRLETTGIPSSDGSVQITISDLAGVTTVPAFDVFSGILTIPFAAEQTAASFTITYDNPDLEGQEIILFNITGVSGGIKSAANNQYQLKVQGAFTSLPDDPSATDIIDARTMDGEVVTLVAYVNTPDYGFGNGQYFLQDNTGGINAIHFSNFGLVNRGDIVKITGEIGEFGSQIQIDVDEVIVLGTNAPLPDPISISASDLTLDHAYQGMLVSIDGVSLTDESQWPTDPISTSSGTNVDAVVGSTNFVIRIDRGESAFDGSDVPDSPFTLSGVLGRFNNDVQIMPFVNSDIQ